jgi:hypothetical protein
VDIDGFNWDQHNRGKCQKHGVSLAEIEALFDGEIMVKPDMAHADVEERFNAIGRTAAGRYVFLVFTLRVVMGAKLLRPISARFMHLKEVRHYEEASQP